MKPLSTSIKKRNGFSLLEVLISTILVAMILISSLRLWAELLEKRITSSHELRAAYLAQQVMTRVLSLRFCDAEHPLSMGRETDEIIQDSFLESVDDIDDFIGWSERLDESWTRRADVSYVLPSAPDVEVVDRTSLKKITVTVFFRDRVVTQLVALKGIHS